MSINTNIPVSETESQVYKKFKSLSINEEPLPQGDGTIRISPFDDYYIFTFYEEVDSQNTPIDLSNVGTIFISFIGETSEIKIPYYTNTQTSNLSQGEVLFRISKDEGKKILNLDNKNFYISTQMISVDGAESDESVIYTGKFLSIGDGATKSLTSQIEDITLQYTNETAKLLDENIKLKKQLNDLKSKLTQSNLTVQALRNSNEHLGNELSQISKELSSESINKALKESKDAQSLADKQKTERNQSSILSEISTSKAKTKLSADRLQKYF
tara:strand:- start:61596 stop:62408 length:813 start_codon:yes stop_codon:yes gene_type:complete